VQASAGGKMPSLTGHLWLGAADAEAAATSLAPKLRKSQAEVSRLLAEACSLEVGFGICGIPLWSIGAAALEMP
jgi:hypothetical protein